MNRSPRKFGKGAALRLQHEVLVVEDDALLRGLVVAAFVSAGYAVQHAADGAEALALARTARPAAVVLDVSLPGISGFEIAHQLRAELGYGFAVVLVSGTRVEELDQRVASLLGSDAYLVKPFDPARLVGVVTSLLARHAPPAPAAADAARLTEREAEVLALVARGKTRRTIGEQLGISPKTVGSHVERIMLKLDTETQAHAVAVALALGLIVGAG